MENYFYTIVENGVERVEEVRPDEKEKFERQYKDKIKSIKAGDAEVDLNTGQVSKVDQPTTEQKEGDVDEAESVDTPIEPESYEPPSYSISSDGAESHQLTEEQTRELISKKDFINDLASGEFNMSISNNDQLSKELINKVETQKILNNPDDFPMKSRDAANTILPDGRNLAQTEEYNQWTYDIVPPTGRDSWIEDDSFFGYLRTEAFRFGRHALGWKNLMPPDSETVSERLPKDLNHVSTEDLFNHYNENTNSEREFDISLRGGTFAGKKKEERSQEVNDMKIHLLKQFEMGPDGTNIPSTKGEVGAVPLFNNDGTPTEAGKNITATSPVNPYLDYEAAGTILNTEGVVVPYLQDHYDEEYERLGLENPIKFESAKGILSGGRDAVRITIGNQKKGTVIPLNNNEMFGAPLDPQALDEITSHIDRTTNPELYEEYATEMLDLYTKNPELLYELELDNRAENRADFWTKLDVLNGKELYDHGDGHRLTKRLFSRIHEGGTGSPFASDVEGEIHPLMMIQRNLFQDPHIADHTGFVVLPSGQKVSYRKMWEDREMFANMLKERKAEGTLNLLNIEHDGHDGHIKYLDSNLPAYFGEEDQRIISIDRRIEDAKAGIIRNGDGSTTSIDELGVSSDVVIEKLQNERNDLIEKYNYTELYDKETGNFIKYKSAWVPHTDPKKSNMMMKVDLEGKPTGEERPIDLSDIEHPDNQNTIKQLAFENNLEELELWCREAHAELLVAADIAHYNWDRGVEGEISGYQKKIGGWLDFDNDNYKHDESQLNKFNETGDVFDVGGDGDLNHLTTLAGGSRAARNFNDKLIKFKILNKARMLNIDPLEQHQENVFKHWVNAISEGYFGESIMGQSNIDISNEQDMWEHVLRENDMLVPPPSNDDFWRGRNSNFRRTLNMGGDVAGGVLPLITEIAMFNWLGTVATGTKTMAHITNGVKQVTNVVKKLPGIRNSRWLTGSFDDVTKTYKGGMIDDLLVPAVALPIEWFGAESFGQMTLGSRFGDQFKGHTFEFDAEKGDAHFNYYFPAAMGLGSGMFAKYIKPGVSKGIEYVSPKTGPMAALYRYMAQPKEFYGRNIGAETGTTITDWVAGAATATAMLEFAERADQFVQDVETGDIMNYEWWPDELKDINSDEYKEWMDKWDMVKDKDQAVGTFWAMLLLQGRGFAPKTVEAIKNDFGKIKRNTSESLAAEKGLSMNDNHKKEKDGKWKKKDIETRKKKEKKKLKKEYKKASKIKDKKKREKEMKKVEDKLLQVDLWAEQLHYRNEMLGLQDGFKSWKDRDKYLSERYDLDKPFNSPNLNLNGDDLSEIGGMNEADFITLLQRTSPENRPKYRAYYFHLRRIWEDAEMYRLLPGRERNDFFRKEFDKVRSKWEIERLKEEIKENPNTKITNEEQIKRLEDLYKTRENEIKELREEYEKNVKKIVQKELATAKMMDKELSEFDEFHVLNESELVEAAKKEGVDLGGGEGFVSTDGLRAYVGLERAAKVRAVDAGRHEIGHKILEGHLMETMYKTVEDGKTEYYTVGQMKSLKKNNPEKYKMILNKGVKAKGVGDNQMKAIDAFMELLPEKARKEVERVIEGNYKYEMETIRVYNENTGKHETIQRYKRNSKGELIENNKRDYWDEHINVFGSLMRMGKIKKTRDLGRKVGSLLYPMLKKVYGNYNKFDINTTNSKKAGEQILNFVEELQGRGMTKYVLDVYKQGESRRLSGKRLGKGARRINIGEEGFLNKNIVDQLSKQPGWEKLSENTKRIVVENKRILNEIMDRYDEASKVNPNITLKQVKDLDIPVTDVLKVDKYGNVEFEKDAEGTPIKSKPKKIKRLSFQQAMVMNNMPLVHALAATDAAIGKASGAGDKAIEKIDFESQYTLELSELARTWDPAIVDVFAAYMKPILRLRKGQSIETILGKGPSTVSMVATEDGKRDMDFEDTSRPDIEADIDANTSASKIVNKIIYSKLFRAIVGDKLGEGTKQFDDFKKEIENVVVDGIKYSKNPDVTRDSFYKELEEVFVNRITDKIKNEILPEPKDMGPFIEKYSGLMHKYFTKEQLVAMQRQMKKGKITDSKDLPFVRQVNRLTNKKAVEDAIEDGRVKPSSIHKVKNGVPEYEKNEYNANNWIEYGRAKSSTDYARRDKIAQNLGKNIGWDAFMEVRQRDYVSAMRKNILKEDGKQMLENEVEIISEEVGRSMSARLSNINIKHARKLFDDIYVDGFGNIITMENGKWVLKKTYGKTKISQETIDRVADSWNNTGLSTESFHKFKKAISESNKVPQKWKNLLDNQGTLHKNNPDLVKKYSEEVLGIVMEFGKDVLTANQMRAFWDVIGFHYRIMDAGKLKTSTGKPGTYYDLKVKAQKAVETMESNPALKEVVEKVRLMNKAFDLFKRIEDIQNMEINVKGREVNGKYKKGKLDYLKELEKEIEDANTNNIDLHHKIVKNLMVAVKKGKISPTTFIHMFQAQTNLTGGFRALSRLDLIELRDGSQAVYKYYNSKKNKWIYTNEAGEGFFEKGEYKNSKGETKIGKNGTYNDKNSLLKDAIKSYVKDGVSINKKGKETFGGEYLKTGKKNPNWRRLEEHEALERAIEKLQPKGEHMGASSNTSLYIVELMADYVSPKEGVAAKSLDMVDVELRQILDNHSQFLTSKFITDILDRGGTTNPTNFHRIKILREHGFGKYIDNIYSPSGKSYAEVLANKEINNWQLENLKKSIENKNKRKVAEGLKVAVRKSIMGKKQGISVFDFDDTLASTKSGVRGRVPNTDGSPKPNRKVIFLAGGAGSGKSNVVKKLGLEEQGFKIVNQDISLEWLKKNHGLPENMRELTKEQRSTLGKLGHQARGIARRKMLKFQGRGNGVVVDGTGASKKNMEKLVNEFKEKGYDVSMLFVETSLETALARNAARKERSLLDIIVRKNHESVMGNKEIYREMFGERFMDVKTDNLKMEDSMPLDLVSKMNDFVRGYERLRLDAEDFASMGESILARGGKFDFSEFNEVIDGTEGPLLKTALERAKKFGTKDMFILTARPAESAKAIQEFLKSQGLDIPLENITGLGNSAANAKAKWMLGKFSEGYNDMYFVDDAIQNVDAVKKVLDQVDVKSNIVQAKARFSNMMNVEFNKMLERRNKNVKAEREISAQEALLMGRGKGRYDYFVPPSAEDFKGLLYKFLGKGRQGDADMKFFKESLLRPFAEGIRDLTIVKQKMSEEYKTLKKKSKNVNLKKEIKGTPYTIDHAIRVHLWDKSGFEIPGISKEHKSKLLNYVRSNPELIAFAEMLSSISRVEKGYMEPGDYWGVESIASDLNQLVAGATRAKFLAEWIENKNIIFSEANMNKIEATHGPWFREALENILWRMESGTNRMVGTKDGVTKWFYDWVNGAVGATMFWNTRSAMLQTISTVNFVNWKENNPFAAASAFANQPQFWKDFAFIMNSPMLKQRRAGLQIDVSASELTTTFEQSGRNPKAILNYFLQKGFTPTRIADSFAIAMGGASYYRNRIKMYKRKGLTDVEAKKKAWLDFQEIAEETQQSSRPDLISQQQAGELGRVILAWQNTPMQMTRLMKKALSDLVNRRRMEGHTTQWQSDRSYISRILYYGAMQNLWFYTLQSGLGWLMFGSDQEEMIEKKELQVLNGSFDTLLRGTGIYGAMVSTLKNTILQYKAQRDMPYGKKDWGRPVIEMISLSPPIGSKVRKGYQAMKTWDYNKGVGAELGFSIENPNIHATANVIEGIFNVPLARTLNKANNLEEAITGAHEPWQRAAMILGWNRWNVGAKDEELEAARDIAEEKQKIEREQIRKEKKDEEKRQQKKEGFKDVRCSGRNSKGKRCSLTSWTKDKTYKCAHHMAFKDGMDRDGDGVKEYRCTFIKKDGKRCKMKGEFGKKKRCYHHD